MNGSIASHVARRFGRFMRVRPSRVNWPGGAVSFTFDDFPQSAIETGGAVLEKHGLRGTYYVSLGLAGSDGNQGPIADRSQIRETHRRGHELACHTYSHLDCSRAAAAAIIDDLRRNAESFAELLGFAPSNFAYPFGRYLLPVRRLVAPRFASCRGTMGGSNCGAVDLADLRATRIYAPQYDEQALRQLIERNRDAGGWLIFYTHDVEDSPSAYGCTPRQLEGLVAHAVAHAAAVLPVRDVLAGLAVQPMEAAAVH
jgi:peptidoglycan/xylan/chitin deacetylase (PgdA/CDA1 family)